MKINLGVNVDHVATVREARGVREPDPVAAAILCELGGADSITCHLREDQRHIHELDVRRLRLNVATSLNLEMAPVAKIISLAKELAPNTATLVPEKRQELTTEGGLDVAGNLQAIQSVVQELKASSIRVSLFIDPETAQVQAAKKCNADCIEFHTGRFANAWANAKYKNFTASAREEMELEVHALEDQITLARKYGLIVHAGHGLNYENVHEIAKLDGISEFNIGHSIIARAVLVGMERAVREMIEKMRLR